MSELLVGMDSVDKLIALFILSLFGTVAILGIAGAFREAKLAKYKNTQASETRDDYGLLAEMQSYTQAEMQAYTQTELATLQRAMEALIESKRLETYQYISSRVQSAENKARADLDAHLHASNNSTERV